MNLLKLITISVSVTLTFLLLVFIIYFLTRKFKSKLNNDGRLKISYGIWYGALFLSGADIISTVINAVIEIIDNLIKINPTGFNLQLVKSISLIIGIGFIWFILWFFVVQFMTIALRLKTDEHQEMEDDNFSYFLIKSSILVGIIFSLSSLLMVILRAVIPNVEIPFYH